jgi:hypothetical protein
VPFPLADHEEGTAPDGLAHSVQAEVGDSQPQSVGLVTEYEMVVAQKNAAGLSLGRIRYPSAP